jgi:hypothetical protein
MIVPRVLAVGAEVAGGEDTAEYRARWPLGIEARLMFDILHYTHLRLAMPPALDLCTCSGR